MADAILEVRQIRALRRGARFPGKLGARPRQGRVQRICEVRRSRRILRPADRGVRFDSWFHAAVLRSMGLLVELLQDALRRAVVLFDRSLEQLEKLLALGGEPLELERLGVDRLAGLRQILAALILQHALELLNVLDLLVDETVERVRDQ